MVLFLTSANMCDLNQNWGNYFILAIFTLLLIENGCKISKSIAAWNSRNDESSGVKQKYSLIFFTNIIRCNIHHRSGSDIGPINIYATWQIYGQYQDQEHCNALEAPHFETFFCILGVTSNVLAGKEQFSVITTSNYWGVSLLSFHLNQVTSISAGIAPNETLKVMSLGCDQVMI